MKERLESAEKLLRGRKETGFLAEREIDAHFAKYTTPQDKLKELYLKWMRDGFNGYEGYDFFLKHFSDFLLTPEKEAELKAEGWNQALDDLLKIIDVKLFKKEISVLKMMKAEGQIIIENLETPQKEPK